MVVKRQSWGLVCLARNFSKPAAPIIAQMYNFLNLGFEGYKQIASKDLRNARLLSRALESTYFTVLSNIHVPVKKNLLVALGSKNDNPEFYEVGLPVVAFRYDVSFYPYRYHIPDLFL